MNKLGKLWLKISKTFWFKLGTLVYKIEVQTQINVQVGEFLKIDKHAVLNKRAGETSCKKLSNVQD